jgi:prepilin-type N-terminal cleavage/methylation domain-containing protein
MKTRIRTTTGFTLLEMIMVLVVMSSVILLITNYGTHRMDQFRRDKTALQMQEVLSAALAYYVNNGAWPTAGTPAVPATLASSSLIPTYLPSISGDMYPFATVNKAGNNKFLAFTH